MRLRLHKQAKIHLVGALALACIFQTPPIHAANEKTPAAKSAPAEAAMVTRFYDLRAWTMTAFDFSLDSSAHSAAFITPANIQTNTFDYLTTGQRYPNRAERNTPTREERIGSLIALIEQMVAPESWRDAGGKASLGEVRDILVVKQTPENQAGISALLQALKDRQGETVAVRADWFILRRAQADELLNDRSGSNKTSVSPHGADLAALGKLSPPVPHFHARLLCLNGQTVSYVSGRERSVLAYHNVSTQDETATFTPFMGNAGAGIALQINPVVDSDGKRAAITFFSTYVDPENPGAPIPVTTTATTQPAGRSNILQLSAPALVEEQNTLVHEFRSTVRLPLNTPTLVGSATLEPTAKIPAAETRELVMILTVRAE